MSGHSHWASIKHKKESADEKRGKIFSKISREISIAAKEGGSDPEKNAKLNFVIEKAKKYNMPKENVERAIKKGTGELAGENLETFSFEALGPAGIAFIIDGITDNKNRTLGEIKQILSQRGGKLANEGAVKWLFDRKGEIIINLTEQTESSIKKDDIEMMAIEAGAEDIKWNEDTLIIFVKIENLEKTKKALEEQKIKIDSASLAWIPKEEIFLSEKEKESCEKIFEALDENDAVQDIFSNLSFN